MSSDDRVAVFVPPLRFILEESERRAGRPLTEADVKSIASHAACIVLTRAEADRMSEARGLNDLNPERVWEQWQEIKGRQNLPQVAEQRSVEALPTDAMDRHEALINLFGRYLFVSRNRTLASIAQIVEAPAAERNKIGKFHREEYDAVAALDPAGREAAVRLARKGIDRFLVEVLALFTHNGAGIEMAIDEERSIAFDVILKILSRETLEPIEQHVVNRNGEKVLYEYFGRWLNKFKDVQA